MSEIHNDISIASNLFSGVRQSGEIELKEILQKKNTTGIYQNRFFVTKGAELFYWTSKSDYDKNLEPSTSYDLKEIRSIELSNKRNILILFGNSKFKLELRALNDEQATYWLEFLKSKKALYSHSDLLNELDESISFKTETFQVLMKLTDNDKVALNINDYLF